MAIPPGSAFKTLTAVALLESATVRPADAVLLPGLSEPARPAAMRDFRPPRHRPRRRDAGRRAGRKLQRLLLPFCRADGPAAAGRLGRRFGFGQPTGIDVPGEVGRHASLPENIRDLEGHAWRTADTQSLAIGQGSLTVTPFQMVRMMAAVANGGRLVRPHVVRGEGSGAGDQGTGDRQSEADGSSLDIRWQRSARGCCAWWPIRRERHMARCISNRSRLPARQARPRRAAIRPATPGSSATPPPTIRRCFVIALEHAGDAATAAGPVARRLVLRMEQLGLL